MRNATNTMLCWNVDTKEIGLVSWPDTIGASGPYNRNVLASFADTRNANFETRKATVLAQALVIILMDKFDPVVVHNALIGLEEYQSAMPPELFNG